MFNVFFIIESVLVNNINNVCLNKWSYLYLVGTSFFKQKIFRFYLLLKSWHFPLMRFGQNSNDICIVALLIDFDYVFQPCIIEKQKIKAT